MTERKAFMRPGTAVFWGWLLFCLFVFLLAYIGLLKSPAYADDEIKDDPCPTQYQAAHAAAAQGAEIHVVTERMQVARGAGVINGSGGSAIGVTGFLVAIYSINLSE